MKKLFKCTPKVKHFWGTYQNLFGLLCIIIFICGFSLTACNLENEKCTNHVSLGWFVTEVPTETTNGKYCDLCCYCGDAIETKEIALIQINTENLEQYYTLDIEVLDSGRSVTLSTKTDTPIVKNDLTVDVELNLSGTLYVNVTPKWTETAHLVLADNNSASQDCSFQWNECYDVQMIDYEVITIEGYCWIVIE